MSSGNDPAVPAELRIGSGAVLGAVPTPVQVYDYAGQLYLTLEEKRRGHLRRILEAHSVSQPYQLIDILIHDLDALTAATPTIPAWKTTDGVLYRTHAEADRRQARLNHEHNLRESTRRCLAE